WRSFLPLDKDGVLVLDRKAAVQVALLESRDYQRELEDLYLSALDVTFQRFRFDAQFFGGNDTYFTADGPDRSGASSSELRTDTDLEMRKLTASGGELVVGMANSLVWQFAGPDDYRGTTLLDFSMVQPLLRAGGRAVVLEQLTDAERALLANIRQMQRFRRAFYIQIVAGGGTVTGVTRGGVSVASLSAGPSATVGGLFTLLSQQVQIRNRRANIAGLRDTLDRFEAYYGAERVSRLQVDQSRQGLYTSQTQLLRLLTNYQDRLDNYKIQLGLPPDIEVRINDKLLDKFNFVTPKMTDTRDAVALLLADMREQLPDNGDNKAGEKPLPLKIELPQAKSNSPADALKKPEPVKPDDFAQQLAEICRQSRKRLEETHVDYEKLLKVLPARRQHLEKLSKRPEVVNGDIDPGVCSTEVLDKRVALLRQDFLEGTDTDKPLEKRLDEVLSRLEKLTPKPLPASEELVDQVELLSGEMLELSLIQARARLDAATLSPVDLKPQEALEIARKYRRDWKNARAALVDTWRQIEVQANDLESDLDVVFSGDMTTKDDHPFRFRGTTGRLRVGLEFDAPLTRLVERNDYREALINYQRARRTYYAYEDLISQNLRATLRVMSQDQLDFEIRRMAVHIAVDQVNQAWLALNEPPRPGEQAGSNLGPTAARDLLNALSGLLDAQDTILDIWVENESRRMALDLNLGTMRLDECGMWIDPAEVPFGKESTGQDAIESLEEIITPQPQTTEESNPSQKLPHDWLFPDPPIVDAPEEITTTIPLSKDA
ncbi:MAG: hypothetical protein JXM70_06730, partial [Pirellulales bacterium]|nr:hypothetical protein [Pirellulales bacterium]